MDSCPVCLSPFVQCYRDPPSQDGFHVNCPRCGRFQIAGTVIANFADGQISSIQRGNISGWLREHSGILIDSMALNQLMKLSSPSVFEKAEKIFGYLARKYPMAGEQLVELHTALYCVASSKETRDKKGQALGNLLGIGWIGSEDEFKYIIRKYLLEEKHFLLEDEREKHLYISPHGWKELEEHPFGESDKVFVAMNFDQNFDSLYEDVIAEAISFAGWIPLRIDQQRKNEYINNLIIAAIRTCSFAVADFTDCCAGVYYEAGLAKGYGKQVIHMARADYIDGGKLHFDTRQIQHVKWLEGKNHENMNNLFLQIMNTVGPGPKYDEDRVRKEGLLESSP